MAKRIIVNTDELAAALHQSPEYVRLLVHRGVIAPLPERGPRGCLRFDFTECWSILDGTPHVRTLDSRTDHSA